MVEIYEIQDLFEGIEGIVIIGMKRKGYVGIGEKYVILQIEEVVIGGN